MIVIPVNTESQTIMVVIIEKANFERMAAADPITLTSIEYGGVMNIKHPSNCRFIIAYEEDSAPLIALLKKNDIPGIIRYIQRGYADIKGLDGIQIEVPAE